MERVSSLKAKRQSVIAFFVCAVFIVTAFACNFFTIISSDHDCSGTNCSICCTIKQFEEIFNNSKAPNKPLPVTAFAVYCSVLILFLNKVIVRKSSPISLKVKLLN